MELRPSLFCLFFCILYFFLPPFEQLGCFSGCLMSSASIQKLFCGIYSMFKCSFDEFVGEKVFSPSYSSAILAPPPFFSFFLLMGQSKSTVQIYGELRWFFICKHKHKSSHKKWRHLRASLRGITTLWFSLYSNTVLISLVVNFIERLLA